MTFTKASALRLVATVLILCAPIAASRAADVRMRLVRADAPGRKVSTAATHIDLEAEREAAEARMAGESRPVKGGPRGPTDVEIKPRAEFDRYCNYMRGIIVDGKHPFHRTYKGSYLGRGDEITLKLADGEHRIDPGGHRFTVKGETISTADPSMRVRDGVLEVTLYPVTTIAINGAAVRDVPAEVLRLPVSPRFYWGEEPVLPREETISASATFKRLTLYMMANTQGAGYRVVPSERHFHVTPAGVKLVDPQGRPATDRGVYTEGRFTIVLPKVAAPVTIRGDGVSVSIAGPAGSFSASALGGDDYESTFNAYSAREGANVRFGTRGENGPFLFQGDFGEFPRRKLLFDAAPPDTNEPRLLAAALPGGSVQAGAALRMRVEARDAIDAATITPHEVRAFLYTKPLLRDDATLEGSPDGSEPLAGWRSLRITPAGGAHDTYTAVIPEGIPSNVYWLRIVVDRRGYGSPRSALATDFVQGIINPAARTTVSVFCPAGRHAFFRGADVPFSAVVKTTARTPAETLKIALKGHGGDFLLAERRLPALSPGRHPFHYVLGGRATEALRPGRYHLVATLGGLTSVQWEVNLVLPRDRDGTPHFDDGWLSPNIDVGTPYANIPADITEANGKRRQLEGNIRSRARRGVNLQIVDWSTGGHGSYQGRDSSSEVAQVEMLLRSELALPAHEVYHYQNHFELMSEVMAGEGSDHISSTPCFIAPLSLIHSLDDQVNAKMRQHQLIAQIARKFENFIGVNPMFMSTSPLGNSELPDPTRRAKLVAMARNFEAKHGFPEPTFAETMPYVESVLATKAPEDPKAGERWEAWMTMINTLMFDYYEKLRTSVDPLFPGMLYTNRGPSWTGDTESGTYPPIANANQGPLPFLTGHGDYGHWFIWWPICATKFHGMAGGDIWGVCGAGWGSVYRHHLGMSLMGGSRGMGYLRGPKPETDDPTLPWNCDDIDELLQVRDLLRSYGPIIRRIQHRAPLAVYYPYHQSMYDTASRAGFATQHSVQSAMMQLSILGYTYEMLTDEMLDAGGIQPFKVVLAPQLYYLLPRHRKALEDFAAKGGVVLVGSTSPLVPAGARKIDDDFQELPYASGYWDFNAIADVGHAWVAAQIRQKAPALRKALEPHLQPFARPRGDGVVLQTGAAGDVRYTFVVNFTYPSWLGTGRITGDPEHSAVDGEANEKYHVPIKPVLEFPPDRHVYDMFTHRKLPAATPAAGRQALECDMTFSPFKILASLPAEIEKLRARLPKTVTLGESFPIIVTPLDGTDKPLPGPIPVEVSVYDAAGENVTTAYGVSGPDGFHRIGASIGFRPGAWKVQIKELVSGRSAEVPLTVKAPERLPFGAAVAEVPKVDVQRLPLVRSFIDARRKDKETVLILLDEEQHDARLPVATALGQQFGKLGITSEISSTNAPGVFAAGERMNTMGGLFREMAPQQFIDHHVVLIGGEGESVLIEELQNSQLFDRSMTQNYPGPGRAILTIVRSAFAYQRDVLCLVGRDNSGLLAAVAKLADLEEAAEPDAADEEEAGLVARNLPATAGPDAVRPEVSGNPVQVIAAAPGGERIMFGTSGYARNLFVFDGGGKLLVEDQVGHVNALGITLLPNGRMAVNGDGTTYLREADGRLLWKLRGPVAVDPQGRYAVHASKGYFDVYDISLNRLWGFDEWDEYETTKEILFGRKATFIGIVKGGTQIVYRLAGKAPGAAGTDMDALIFADALTGREVSRVPVEMAALHRAAGITNPRATVKSISIEDDGFLLVVFTVPRSTEADPVLLLNSDLRPVAAQQFDLQPYFGEKPIALNRHVVWEHRLAFTVGDTLYLGDPEWRTASSVQTSHQILGLAADEARRRIAISNYAGELIVLDENLRKLWESRLPTAARLAFLPDGRLAAGTVRGTAMLFSITGERLWEHSLKRYAPPDEVDKRWRAVEQTPGPARGAGSNWWQRLQQNIKLGADLAGLSDTVRPDAPLRANLTGEPFETYLVTWKCRTAKGKGALTLTVVEDEKPAAAGAPKNTVQRLSLSAAPGDVETARYAILRLGDRPESIRVAVECAAGLEAATTVSVQPLLFPSKNHIRMDAIYRGRLTEGTYVEPPAKIEMFFNVTEKGDPHTTRYAEPTNLINGRMLEKEPELLKGKWWGGGTTFKGHRFELIPFYVEIVLPQKRVLTHIVLAEDPSLQRGETITVDAFIESREVRSNVSAYERRQLARGFWLNVVKFRGNNTPYNVFKFEKPVYAKKLRIYVLEGYSSLSEIELYGGLSEETAN